MPTDINVVTSIHVRSGYKPSVRRGRVDASYLVIEFGANHVFIDPPEARLLAESILDVLERM